MTDRPPITSPRETLGQRAQRVRRLLHERDLDYAGETVQLLLQEIVDLRTLLDQHGIEVPNA